MSFEPAFEDRHGGLEVVAVPGQILIAFVAKLTLYGFWPGEGRFAELLRILEKDGATGLARPATARRGVLDRCRT